MEMLSKGFILTVASLVVFVLESVEGLWWSVIVLRLETGLSVSPEVLEKCLLLILAVENRSIKLLKVVCAS